MAKRMGSVVYDAALNYIKNNCNKMTACSAEPTTYAEGNATYALADAAMSSTDFTVAAGDGGGSSRKNTVAAKNTITVDANGTATHVALLNTTGSELLAVTTCTSQVLTAGNTVNFPSWKIEIASPT
jgi:hypothetical protein